MAKETKTTAGEPKYIDVTAGPYIGSQLQVSAEDFDLAIAENWGRDPYARNAAPAAELTQHQQYAARDAAEKAARRWRGEPEPGEPPLPPAEQPPAAIEPPAPIEPVEPPPTEPPPAVIEPPVEPEPEPEPEPGPGDGEEGIDEEVEEEISGEPKAAAKDRASTAKPSGGSSYSTRQSTTGKSKK